MELEWKRPVLCRICECPAADGSVRVDQLDEGKLAHWWRTKLGVEFQPFGSQLICQFCLWKARYSKKGMKPIRVDLQNIFNFLTDWSMRPHNQMKMLERLMNCVAGGAGSTTTNYFIKIFTSVCYFCLFLLQKLFNIVLYAKLEKCTLFALNCKSIFEHSECLFVRVNLIFLIYLSPKI